MWLSTDGPCIECVAHAGAVRFLPSATYTWVVVSVVGIAGSTTVTRHVLSRAQNTRTNVHRHWFKNRFTMGKHTMDYTQLLDLSTLSHAFSSNMYVSALVMILLNVGTSYLMQDLMPIAHRIFSVLWVRRLVFFAIFFTATRDLKVSVLLMVVFTLLVDIFLNEDSDYCLIPYEHRLPKQPPPPSPPQSPSSPSPPQSPSPSSQPPPQSPSSPPQSTTAPNQPATTEAFQVQQNALHHTIRQPHQPRLERFQRNAQQWSLSRRPVSYW